METNLGAPYMYLIYTTVSKRMREWSEHIRPHNLSHVGYPRLRKCNNPFFIQTECSSTQFSNLSAVMITRRFNAPFPFCLNPFPLLSHYYRTEYAKTHKPSCEKLPPLHYSCGGFNTGRPRQGSVSGLLIFPTIVRRISMLYYLGHLLKTDCSPIKMLKDRVKRSFLSDFPVFFYFSLY